MLYSFDFCNQLGWALTGQLVGTTMYYTNIQGCSTMMVPGSNRVCSVGVDQSIGTSGSP